MLNYKRHDLKELKRLRANTTSELDAILKNEKKDERRVDELKAHLNGLDEQINSWRLPELRAIRRQDDRHSGHRRLGFD